MFGYVTANCRALTQQQLARYRGCYCGLCRALNEKYGFSGRMTVSYDMTFLIMLLASLYEAQESSALCRCPTHPIKPQSSWACSWTDYGADLAVLLAWHNADDSVRDGHKLVGASLRAMLNRAYAKACRARPEESALIAAAMEKLVAVENSASADTDAAAKVFGDMLGSLFAVTDDRWNDQLHRLGDYLGRFIYMADAVCDLKKDLKSGDYNPLKSAWLSGERDFTNILSILMAECTHSFEVLPLVQDVQIMRNILYSGVWQKLTEVSAGRKGKKANE